MESLSGRTIQWTFADGPTAGIGFEHEFHPDGSVTWRGISGAFLGAERREKQYGATRINAKVWAVSYLAASGHTLTVILDFEAHTAVGFASNESTWAVQQGTFAVIR